MSAETRRPEPLLPTNPMAERNVIGAAMEDPAAMDAASGIVTADDFTIEGNRLIFAAMLALREQGEVANLITVCEHLRKSGLLGQVGGQANLSAMTTSLDASSWQIASTARIVKDIANQRRIIALVEHIAHLGYDERHSPAEALDHIREELHGASERILRGARPEERIISAAALRTMTIPDPHLIVAGIVPEGLSILGGRPKMGKSWLALNLAISVSLGRPALGYTSTDPGNVLYLALEDTLPRLHGRMQQCCPDGPWPERLAFATRCPTLDAGGLLYIENWLRQAKEPRMVIADTYAVLRGNDSAQQNGNQYAADYAALTSLKRLADAYRVGLVAVHHLRKSGSASDDPLEELSGTNAISGAADNILVLKRPRGEMDGTLHVAGRDIEEQEYAVRFDAAGGWWNIAGDAASVRVSREREEILTYLRQCSDAMSASELSALTGRPSVSVRRMLHDMKCSGQVVCVRYGKYRPSQA